jgi:predicted ArsR family transcriptional regulator
MSAERKTAFEILQSKLSIKDTATFRKEHLPEILEAMEQYAKEVNQDKVREAADKVVEVTAKATGGTSDNIKIYNAVAELEKALKK